MLVGAPTFEEVYKTEIAPILNKIELAVIHNAAFDSVFMATEILNLGEPLPEFETFCTMENGRWATFSGKNPNLGELCYALDVDYDPKEAHAADYDVFKMMDCFFAGRSLNRFKLEGEE
jgi:DNA polymerase III epsilon subunit-like protein